MAMAFDLKIVTRTVQKPRLDTTIIVIGLVAIKVKQLFGKQDHGQIAVFSQ
jgi:hypothetical protein